MFCKILQAFACFNTVFQVSARFCRFLQGFAGSELEPREAVEAKRLYKTVFARFCKFWQGFAISYNFELGFVTQGGS